MKVSVVIPVYNAEAYIADAVSSALAQPEIGEVLLIEDGSQDNSLQVCQRLAEKYSRVKLLQHNDGKNHGAGASRNLGIRNAEFDYIAFLDADDFFLPDHFSVPKVLFESDPEIDGVYEAMGIEFEDQASRERWLSVRGHTDLTTMTERVAPEELFKKQSPVGSSGYCTTGGWVVKRAIFDKTGLFDEHLRLHQDTVMFVKFAAVGKMVPGRLSEPVVVRRVHVSNRSSMRLPSMQVYRDHIKMWMTLWRWTKRHISRSRQNLILHALLSYASSPYRDVTSSFGKRVLPRIQITVLALRYPALIGEKLFWLYYRRALIPFQLRKTFACIRDVFSFQ